MKNALPRTLLWATAGCLLTLSSCGIRSKQSGGLEVGKEAPPIEAAGWLNGEPPTAENLKGKVVVVDVWASW